MSNTFKDTEGRVWTVKVTYGTLVRVQDATGIDLTKILDPSAGDTDDALQSPATLLRVLCAVLRPQLDERKVTDAAFADCLTEDEGEAAGLALYQSIIEFFRGPKRDALSSGFRKMTEAAAASGQGDGSADGVPGGAGSGSGDRTGPGWQEVCCRFAGILGLDPEPRTLRELSWMVDGQQEDVWTRTATLQAAMHNYAFGSKGGKTARDFLPKKDTDQVQHMTMAEAEAMFKKG